jgi:hypothetical protein
MRKNAVLATRFGEFSFKTRAMVAENRVQAGFCVDFVGFCQARADSGHG